MQRLIAWLLQRFTPFRVLAWDRGKIAGIGYSNIAANLASVGCVEAMALPPAGVKPNPDAVSYGGTHYRRHGHSGLRWNRVTEKYERFDPHPEVKER